MDGTSRISAPGRAADQRFALDLRDVDGMRRAARSAPEEGLKQVSRQFEALFIGMMLKSMRDANPSSGLLESQGGKMYLSMLDQQLAQTLSGKGLKLADAMFAQLRRTLPASETPRAAAAAAPAGGETPSTPAPSRADAQPSTAAPQAAQPAQGAAAPEATRPRPAVGATSRPASLTEAIRGQVDGFVTRIGDAAHAASRASGVPAVLIMAQAALESGWGRREIRGSDGVQSFNLFGIKADRSWRGPVAESATTEYVGGVIQRVTAKFRAYGSYEEAFADYAKFLKSNPRYAGVLAAKDPAEAARGLHRAGYATDPDYADKLVRVMQRLF